MDKIILATASNKAKTLAFIKPFYFAANFIVILVSFLIIECFIVSFLRGNERKSDSGYLLTNNPIINASYSTPLFCVTAILCSDAENQP
ncbi:hypothetical protein A8135_01310 [Legionella jamestowniensis]|uniref:Uncharacterized protein n=1 Tax=Legionella jamestowniensis TaxID=455 RepID=A0ABX2XVJ9_9GAMM|nr:hypothetical protein A8135_01310 [Legionella jamestowniensis]TIG73511.1 hypothetical protein DI129_00965 [Legionella pneumophila]TIG85481.1 hypothetical protein DI110_08285 [Legionella pneumophila]TIG93293.1 hypothetical protein DI130_06910 [Legionella pneumophila]TIG94712.1 hypothetical protein DI125_06910 [Legionella pneumophila]